MEEVREYFGYRGALASINELTVVPVSFNQYLLCLVVKLFKSSQLPRNS